MDVADEASLERALDVQLLHGAALDDRDARLLRGPVDQDVLLHSFVVPDEGGHRIPEVASCAHGPVHAARAPHRTATIGYLLRLRGRRGGCYVAPQPQAFRCVSATN